MSGRLPSGLRWWELRPEVALGVGLAVFVLTEPSAATSAFRSSTAIGLMAAAALGWLVVRLVTIRAGRRWALLRAAAFGAAALLVLTIVVLPAYDDTTVVEALPVASGAAPGDEDPATALPHGDPGATTAAPPVTQGPRVIAEAGLHGIDHEARGTVRIYEQGDAGVLVGLEDIDVQPGPDYDLYLVPGSDREDIDDGRRLDDLRGNRGTQYYEVPADLELAPGGWTVLVWCQTFDVPVAGATPR